MSKKYDRNRAVQYALTYGNKPNPQYPYFKIYGEDGGDCTNFVSQCLKSGGIEMVYHDKAPWWFNDDKHTISWTSSHSLYWCLKVRYQEYLNGPRGKVVNDLSSLTIGDLIFYRDMQDKIDHCVIVTTFLNNLPLITQHSPELVNVSHINPKKSKMIFMKLVD